MAALIEHTAQGIYVPPAGAYIDPHRKVDAPAIITHAHSDHARRGHRSYYSTPATAIILGARYGIHDVEAYPFEAPFMIEGVTFTFYPAGHILGSAQVLIEYGGQGAVVTGDYNPYPSPGLASYDVLKCDHLVMESTFGLPLYFWPPVEREVDRIYAWWHRNQMVGRTSVLTAYSLGKAQRLQALLTHEMRHEQIGVTPVVAKMNDTYAEAGAELTEAIIVDESTDTEWMREALIITPPQTLKGQWAKKMHQPSLASASGWNATKKRRQKGFEAYFVLSDHADWPGLVATATKSSAQRVDVMHGFTGQLADHLQYIGIHAQDVSTL